MVDFKENSIKSGRDSKTNLTHISILQIIGPIFVILGHSLNGLPLVSGISFTEMTGFSKLWYMFSKEWIYIFHMALFFMISGYLFTAKGYMRGKSYGEFIKGKFWRLLFPYLFWNAICYIPKIYFQQLTPDTVSLDFWGIIGTFLSPRANIWGHTWFLAALFLIYLAAPIWERIFKNKKDKIIMLLIGVLLYFLPIRTFFLCLSDLRTNILFFSLGCVLGGLSLDKFYALMKKYRIFYIAGAIIFSAVFLVWEEELEFLNLIPCSFILIALMSLASIPGQLSDRMRELSKRSFGIYIMHWPVMITVRTICLYLNLNIVLTVVLMVICGFVIPNIILSLLKMINFKKGKYLTYLLGA